MESRPFTPSPPAGLKRPGWAGLVLLAAVTGVGGYFAGHANIIQTLASGASPAPAADGWVGVWFKHKDVGDGFELPAIELRKGGRGLAGRMICPGRDNDIGHEVEELAVGEDGITFVTTTEGRIKYRLVRTGQDIADLQTVTDTAHDLAAYLGSHADGVTSNHSPARREKALQNLNAPRPPERVARLVRVSQSLPTVPRVGSVPATPPVHDDALLRKPER
jgi:hypothetical protein